MSLMDQVVRERQTSDYLKEMDRAEIVDLIHSLEDELKTVEIAREFADRMADLLDDICDGADPEDWSALMRYANTVADDWRELRETAEVER